MCARRNVAFVYLDPRIQTPQRRQESERAVYKNVFGKSQLQPVKMRDVAYDIVRQAIIVNKLAPGERLLEEHLARELSVSRTPLREALKVLENEGFVQRLPNGGYQVAPLSYQELDNLYSIRLALEGLASRNAAEHGSEEAFAAAEEWNEQMKANWLKERTAESLQAGRSFHAEIYRASGNDNLALLLGRLSNQITRYRYYSIVYRVLDAYDDHCDILAALRARDVARAEALARRHVEVEQQLVLQKMRELRPTPPELVEGGHPAPAGFDKLSQHRSETGDEKAS